jgi:isoamylase
MIRTLTMTEGRPAPLGATFDGEGVNFAVFSEHATRISVCIFSDDGQTETHRLDLPERNGDVWHGYVSGLRPGLMYGLQGRWALRAPSRA